MCSVGLKQKITAEEQSVWSHWPDQENLNPPCAYNLCFVMFKLLPAA